MTFSIVRDEISAPFFDAALMGRLLIRRCAICSTYHAPQILRCSEGHHLQWTSAEGTGSLIAWGIEHATPLDPMLATQDGSSSVFGILELAEGPWIHVPIVGIDPSELTAGTSMVIRFLNIGGGEPVPVVGRLMIEPSREK